MDQALAAALDASGKAVAGRSQAFFSQLLSGTRKSGKFTDQPSEFLHNDRVVSGTNRALLLIQTSQLPMLQVIMQLLLH